MHINAGVIQTGIFISAEAEDALVHLFRVKQANVAKHIKIFYRKTCDLFKEVWFQLCDNILDGLLTIVGKIHERRNTGGKFEKVFLHLFAEGFDLFLLLGDFLLFLLVLFIVFLLCLFNGFAAVDNSFDFLVQGTEALNLHQGFKGVRVVLQTLQGVIVHMNEQSCLPAFSKQCSGCSGISNIENVLCGNHIHRRPVKCKNRQELHKLADLRFGVRVVGIQTARVIRNLSKRTVKGKVKNVALFLDDFRLAFAIDGSPRRLHTESGLEVGFRGFQIAEHKYAGPGTNRHAGHQFTARESDSLCLQRIIHCSLDRRQSIHTDSGFCSCTHDYLVIMEEFICRSREKIPHSKASRNRWHI